MICKKVKKIKLTNINIGNGVTNAKQNKDTTSQKTVPKTVTMDKYVLLRNNSSS